MRGAPAPTAPSHGGTLKARVFWSTAAIFTVGDVITKYWAHTELERGVPHPVLGEFLRIRLNYNAGAAFGMYLGPHSRWIFLALALVILAVLGSMYRQAEARDWPRALALGLVCGGALGNVINRLWSAQGVVDFIDAGIGASRWPTFNVADIGVTTGAVLLAWVLWREEHPAKANPNP